MTEAGKRGDEAPGDSNEGDPARGVEFLEDEVRGDPTLVERERLVRSKDVGVHRLKGEEQEDMD